MAWLFETSLRNRLMVIVLVLVATIAGLRAMTLLPIDALPDVTPNVVQVVTDAAGLSAAEVEEFVTFPVEVAMRGLPGVNDIRSISRFGLSSVWIYFDEFTDIYFARRLVGERLPAASDMIPPGFGTPQLTPVSTGLGEIFQFEVKDPHRSLMELRAILDWQIAPRLKEVPGVVEVNSYGGQARSYEVQLRPDALVQYHFSLQQVFAALERNNASAGGGYLLRNGEQEVIRGAGLVRNLRDLGNIVVGARDDVPVYIHSLGRVRFAPLLRQGAVTADGHGETVAGVVMLLIGQNGRIVTEGVKAKLAEIAGQLPPGVKIVPYYDRTDLIRRTIDTVIHNLVEGALLVAAVLLLFLGNLRASMIVAAVIPLAMLVAFMGMYASGVSGNLMSLGAIDFGLVVDGSVVMMENIFRHLLRPRPADEPVTHTIYTAGKEVLRPIVFATVIIIIVYLPILTFREVEGKMFRPMALTVIFALSGALLCSITIVPVLASLFLSKVTPREPWLARSCEALSARIGAAIAAWPRLALALSAAIFAASVIVAPFLGTQFIPTLDEGSVNLDVMRVPSISLEGAIADATRTEKALLQLPAVSRVISRTGRPEIATDTNGPDESDIYVFLKPRSQWQARDKHDLIERMRRKLARAVPGTRFGFSQPIESRINDMLAGIKADVAIHIYGDDMDRMLAAARRIMDIVSRIPGAEDPKIVPRAGLPALTIEIDRDAVARYGINVSDVLDTVRTIGGRLAGQVIDGQARFPIQVRFALSTRDSLAQLRNIQVAAPGGALIPLDQLAHFVEREGPVAIWRENLARKVTVAVNVSGTDLGGFVAEAKARLARQFRLPRGWRIEWGGQYENLARAAHRLALLTPVALLLILVLLYNTFGSMRMALLVFSNVLLAASGGIFALLARGMPFSITAGVGFITLSGVSVLNGVVLTSEINRLVEDGMPVAAALEQAGRERLRPILMASLVALFGFLPMAVAASAGAEVQRPLATVVIGGLITSTPFTLYVLPLAYRWLMNGAIAARNGDEREGREMATRA
jgi:cobalt-zinc-cadmium resistance protein CzcA